MGRVQTHNKEVRSVAEYRASEMKLWPSPLEDKMKEFLDKYHVRYESQKIFYIYADDGWIIRYYIADFYIPSTNLIIEVDGKFHDEHKQHDKERTRIIQENYPNVRVYRWKWNDFKSPFKVNELLRIISFNEFS